MELMQANREWSSRPDEERFTSLLDIHDHALAERKRSKEVVVNTRDLSFKAEDGALKLFGANGHGYAPTHWGFGQIATFAEAPSNYLRTLSADLAAQNLNYGYQQKRQNEEVKLLMARTADGTPMIRSQTGPNYGRVWDYQIVAELMRHYGDGRTGQFRVPGEWGKAIEVTKANTTLYRGDRSMFLFLVDEVNRIEIPNRRDGQSGSMARGFFLSQSEVMASSIWYGTFLFDFVCGNRIVWGAQSYCEDSMRHSKNAPDKWKDFIGKMVTQLNDFAGSSTADLEATLKGARQAEIEDVDAFLTKQFGKRSVEPIKVAHVTAEGRPIETLWDVIVAATQHAHLVHHQEARLELETKAGALLDMVAVR